MILAVDTASRWTGIALYDEESATLIIEKGWFSVKRQTVELAAEVQSLLSASGLDPSQLTGLVTAIGPGSYTGLRIGLGLLKGFALVHQLPIVGIHTHDIVAADWHGKADGPFAELIVTVEAGRKRILIARYLPNESKEFWIRSEEFDNPTWPELLAQLNPNSLIVGEISEEGMTMIDEAKAAGHKIEAAGDKKGRSAGMLAFLGWQQIRSGEAEDPATLTPFYLRSPEGR